MSIFSRPGAGIPVFKKSEEEIRSDLESLVQRALELGVKRASLIDAEKVVVDDRVQFKCRYPPCANYGRLLMCPPHSMEADETRKLLKNYRYALLLRNEAEAEEIVGFEVYEKKPYRDKYSVPLHEVINQLEAEAFYMGYYYALGLKSGPCLLCAKEVYENKGEWPKSLPCVAIKSGVCKHPLKARPCLEAVGIDVYATANNAGWPIYVVGIRSDPKQVPCVGFHGLLLTC